VCYDQDVKLSFRLLGRVAGPGVLAGLAATLAPAAGVPLAGCLPCRAIEARPLALDCTAQSTFRGELHFTDAATFRSFLTDRCLGPDAVAAADALVAGVDFGTDAVVVGRGPRAGTGRCIEARAVESVSICDDGVRIAFVDTITSALPCTGDWTVAVLVSRSELRSALADGEDDDDNNELPVPG
jgi:hypothetical protein